MKTLVFLAVVLSLVFLLGSSGEKRRSQEPKCQLQPASGWRQDINEYTIVRASDPDKLQKEVNKRVKESWHPMGGISIVDTNCCQVMVK
jgi:hypothetical protein